MCDGGRGRAVRHESGHERQCARMSESGIVHASAKASACLLVAEVASPHSAHSTHFVDPAVVIFAARDDEECAARRTAHLHGLHAFAVLALIVGGNPPGLEEEVKEALSPAHLLAVGAE